MVLVKRHSRIRTEFSRDELVDRVAQRTESLLGGRLRGVGLGKAKGECRKQSAGRLWSDWPQGTERPSRNRGPPGLASQDLGGEWVP